MDSQKESFFSLLGLVSKSTSEAENNSVQAEKETIISKNIKSKRQNPNARAFRVLFAFQLPLTISTQRDHLKNKLFYVNRLFNQDDTSKYEKYCTTPKCCLNLNQDEASLLKGYRQLNIIPCHVTLNRNFGVTIKANEDVNLNVSAETVPPIPRDSLNRNEQIQIPKNWNELRVLLKPNFGYSKKKAKANNMETNLNPTLLSSTSETEFFSIQSTVAKGEQILKNNCDDNFLSTINDSDVNSTLKDTSYLFKSCRVILNDCKNPNKKAEDITDNDETSENNFDLDQFKEKNLNAALTPSSMSSLCDIDFISEEMESCYTTSSITNDTNQSKNVQITFNEKQSIRKSCTCGYNPRLNKKSSISHIKCSEKKALCNHIAFPSWNMINLDKLFSSINDSAPPPPIENERHYAGIFEFVKPSASNELPYQRNSWTVHDIYGEIFTLHIYLNEETRPATFSYQDIASGNTIAILTPKKSGRCINMNCININFSDYDECFIFRSTLKNLLLEANKLLQSRDRNEDFDECFGCGLITDDLSVCKDCKLAKYCSQGSCQLGHENLCVQSETLLRLSTLPRHEFTGKTFCFQREQHLIRGNCLVLPPYKSQSKQLTK
jgi:hypothetical protein